MQNATAHGDRNPSGCLRSHKMIFQRNVPSYLYRDYSDIARFYGAISTTIAPTACYLWLSAQN
jgi:hypothetical protein